MSNPIKQYYIPRSYLKNFAVEGRKRNHFVDVYKMDNDMLLEQISIKDICFEKNIYTIPAESDEVKYALEKHYAENVDSEFPKIYKLLVDEKVLTVSQEQKNQVLYVCLSLYFRTPRILNLQKGMNKQIFDRAAYTANEHGLIKMNLFGEKMEFHIDEIEEVKKQYDERSRTAFLVNHLEQWGNFVKYKYDCTINVIKIEDSNAPIITCDNPVSIRHFETNKFQGLYDPKAVITLPLDRSHYLEIHPNDYADGQTRINRLTQDRDYVFTTNGVTQQNAENLLVAYKGDIDKHFEIQNHYEKPENGEEFLKKAKYRSEQALILFDILKKKGFVSKEFIGKLKELLEHPYCKDDIQMLKYKKVLSKMGKW